MSDRYLQMENLIIERGEQINQLQKEIEVEKKLRESDCRFGSKFRRTAEQLQAKNKKLRKAYSEIFEQYVPLKLMDEANDKLILLLEPDEQMARDMLKAHPIKESKE